MTSGLSFAMASKADWPSGKARTGTSAACSSSTEASRVCGSSSITRTDLRCCERTGGSRAGMMSSVELLEGSQGGWAVLSAEQAQHLVLTTPERA